MNGPMCGETSLERRPRRLESNQQEEKEEEKKVLLIEIKAFDKKQRRGPPGCHPFL